MNFASPDVEARFEAFPIGLRGELLWVRSLIFQVASNDPRIGTLVECLKWGQPAYHPKRARVGTTLRLGATAGDDVAIYYHCQSRLGEQIDAHYGDLLQMDHRSITFPVNNPTDPEILRHCIQMALTYHVSKNPADCA